MTREHYTFGTTFVIFLSLGSFLTLVLHGLELDWFCFFF